MIPASTQKLVYLIWQDASSIGGWHDSDDIDSLILGHCAMVEQIGWIVFEDTREIHMVSRRGSWNKDGTNINQFGQYQRIPKTWVINRKEISVTPKKKKGKKGC